MMSSFNVYYLHGPGCEIRGRESAKIGLPNSNVEIMTGSRTTKSEGKIMPEEEESKKSGTRVKIEDLPSDEKELTKAEKRKVRGGEGAPGFGITPDPTTPPAPH
jgi:hypothetical protein